MKNTNKIISALLALIMLLTIIPAGMISAGAEDIQATVNVESVTALPGSTVEVNVEIQNNPGILGATFELSYGEGLTLTNAVQGAALDCLTMTKPGRFTSPCKFAWDGQEISSDQIKDGAILTLTFDVAEDVEAGAQIPVSLSYAQGDIVDRNLKSIDVDINNGAVSIIDYTPGDVDASGAVNALDVILVRRHIAGGYDVVINTRAANVNGDKDHKINTTDVILIRRFIAGGYDVELLPDPITDPVIDPTEPPAPGHVHNTEFVPAKEPTTEEDGNIAYWRCKDCDKYFEDADGNNEIIPKDRVIIPKIEPDPNRIPITYNLYDGDTYLESVGVNNPNPDYYLSSSGLTLKNLKADGYIFDGWYDGEGANGELVKTISAGSTEEVELYARWRAREYTIHFDNSTNNKIVEVPSKTYKVSEGATLSNPEWHGYTFLGWTDGQANLVKRIAPGTTGNITLYANWTSKRNQTIPIKELADPIIVEDSDAGVFLFTYEIGRIENVPLYTIKDFGHLGMGIDEEYTTSLSGSVSNSSAEAIAEVVAKATTKTTGWTLSKDWNNSVTLSESHLHELGSSKTYTIEDGMTHDGKLIVGANLGGEYSNTVELSSKDTVSGKLSGELSFNREIGAKLGLPLDGGAELGVSNKKNMGLKLGAELSATHEEGWKDTTTESSNWNINAGYEASDSTSHNESLSDTQSSRIQDQYGYSTTRSEGGSQSESYQNAETSSQSREYQTTVAYSEEQITTETKTYKTQNAAEGYYRLVAAGVVHVFAEVGYDIATGTYFTNTYNILDGSELKEFWDYSKNTSGFDDYENGVLPFEVPRFVEEYINDKMTVSEGLEVDENTGIITGFEGNCKDLVIPDYMSVDNGVDHTVVKVTGIADGVFEGKTNIETVKLGRYITAIPNRAFKDCSSLDAFECPSVTSIGEEAFSGCTSLNTFKINEQVTELGNNAFAGVREISVGAVNKAVANATLASGALNISLSDIADEPLFSNKIIEIPASVQSFSLFGNGKTYDDLRINSKAEKTTLNYLTINTSKGVPLKCTSPDVTLNRTTINAPEFAIILTADNTDLKLYSNVNVSSDTSNAILCKNVALSKSNNSVASSLNVDDTVYICGTLTGEELLNANLVYPISESTFEQLSQNSVEWVLASEAPSNANIIAEKWTYDQRYTTTSSSSSLPGWTKYKETWEWGPWGNWSDWSRSAPNPGASDSREVKTRTVTDSNAYTTYKYWRYVNDAGTLMSAWQGYDGCNNYQEIELSYPLQYNKHDANMDLYMEYTYNGNTYLRKHWLKGEEIYHPEVTHTEWHYRDRSKVYTYYFERFEELESPSDPTGQDEVSNVQRWVKYIVD